MLRSQGALLQADPAGLDADTNTRSFSAHFTGNPPPCVRAAPHITVGMVGEWLFCDTPDRKDGKCDFEDNVGMATLSSYNRKTRHMINGLSNRDSVGCGSGTEGAVCCSSRTLMGAGACHQCPPGVAHYSGIDADVCNSDDAYD